MDIRYLTDDFAVSPQMDVTDAQGLADAGFRAVICNRPDAEIGPDQATSEMKKAVDTPTINLPSPAFMGAMMRMVDDSVASENAPIRIEDMTPQTYLVSVIVFTHMTLAGLSEERRQELSQMQGSIRGW